MMHRNSEVFKIVSFVYKRNVPKFMNIPRFKQYETTDFNSSADKINISRENILKDKIKNYFVQ
tara:strand:+ start:5780 stop:5968 length:189 start_codon:yes stop_codon:yes gene_type:complete